MDLQKLMDQLGAPMFIALAIGLILATAAIGAAILGPVGGLVGAIAAGLLMYELHRMGTRRSS